MSNVIADNVEMSNILNTYFSSVFTQETSERVSGSKLLGFSGEQDLRNIEINEEIVLNYVTKLKDNKAPGTDDLGSLFIKRIGHAIVLPLVLMFRKSLESTMVPKQWKEANVTAIYKKKSHRWDPSNYRPVSLTSQVCKIFERIIRDSMVEHLETNKLIDDSQHGFRNHKSCLTNLLEFFGRGY